MDMSLSKLQEIVKDREAWHAAAYGVRKSRTLLRDWTTNNSNNILHIICACMLSRSVMSDSLQAHGW